MACCPRASSFVRHTEERGLAKEHLTVSALSAPCDGSPMTVRGGGVPYSTMALMPSHRMGPPPRSSAADAHHRIMVWVFGPPQTRMWHDHSCTQPQLPSDVVIPTTASVPSCSEPSRTRPFGWRYAPSLSAPARAGVSIEWVGTKKRAAQVEQRN